MKRIFAPSVVALSLLAAPAFAQDLAPMAGSPATQPSVTDQHFVQNTIQSNYAEIALSKLAMQRSQQDAVKSFAQRMVADHQTANDALKPLADKDGFHQPEDMNARHTALAARLANLSGPQFDRAYVEAMVRDHDVAVKAFNHEIAAGKNREIVAWAKTNLPTIQQHDQMAHGLQRAPTAAS